MKVFFKWLIATCQLKWAGLCLYSIWKTNCFGRQIWANWIWQHLLCLQTIKRIPVLTRLLHTVLKNFHSNEYWLQESDLSNKFWKFNSGRSADQSIRKLRFWRFCRFPATPSLTSFNKIDAELSSFESHQKFVTLWKRSESLNQVSCRTQYTSVLR